MPVPVPSPSSTTSPPPAAAQNLGPALAEMAAKGQPIPWSPVLSVGIDSIDSQHRVLLAYVNLLSSSIVREQSAAVLADVVTGLDSYTRLHFRHEERLFALHGWPEHEDHERGHRHFEHQLQSFKERLAVGDHALARDVLRFLIAWLAEHILEEDMAFSPFLRERGVR